ncbi:hypothetical protein O181_011135 [Austropuccinia psidii MF-1]|uniref:Uncharacterized protein n=1 Tax=Austropuccinia psidii MF-1 TaxID=1389203 RepID=A0A9Q3BVB6_9BASI|nr:hypothetical protein [Austropuccinia psidii MF-1]
MISPVPTSINLSTPLLGHHSMVTSLLDWRKVIIQLMKDGDGKRRFELGPIVTMSCHPWDSNTKVKQNPPNPLQQDSPLPCTSYKQAPQKPTPGMQWLEDLFHKPSKHNEPPIPGPSQASEPHEDPLACEPEPEVAPMQSTEENFACPATPASIIIINNTPIRSPPPPEIPPIAPENTTACSPWRQAPLNPTMRLGRNLRNCN